MKVQHTMTPEEIVEWERNPRGLVTECPQSFMSHALALLESEGSMTHREFANRTGGSRAATHYALLVLLRGGRIARSGDGGQTDPFVYRLSEARP